MQLKRLNRVTNKMLINRKMFHARMKDRISKEISGIKVVREQGGRQLHWCKKFRQQRFYPLQFGSGNRNFTILNLSRRTSNNAFLGRALGNWITTKENKKKKEAPMEVRSSGLPAQSALEKPYSVKGVSVRS